MRWADRVGRFLKPRDLHVFMTVVEEGSMAKAAERLAISLPVISRTIANLEHHEHVTRGDVLTALAMRQRAGGAAAELAA